MPKQIAQKRKEAFLRIVYWNRNRPDRVTYDIRLIMRNTYRKFSATEQSEMKSQVAENTGHQLKEFMGSC
jgi:hypothetical protein